jgi:hypothetical protein
VRVDGLVDFLDRGLELMARPYSAISSVASAPMMCAPRISPCLRVADHLHEALGLAAATALPLAL